MESKTQNWKQLVILRSYLGAFSGYILMFIWLQCNFKKYFKKNTVENLYSIFIETKTQDTDIWW